MLRITYIEQIRRLIYGGQPDDDAEITVGLVNVWLNHAIANAAKQNYKDALTLDGISYVNNSFYTTFKNLEITEEEQFLWKIELPQIPIGIGTSEGISTIKFKDYDSRQISYPVVWLSQNQLSFQDGMRNIPNRLLAYSEGKFIYIKSTIQLSDYTAQATMISGGDSDNLQGELNVPDDYIQLMTEYLKTQFMFSRSVPKDLTPDGQDFIRST